MSIAKEILADHINGCSCDDAYKSRNLTAPDCFWCNESESIVEAMQEYAMKCLQHTAEKVADKAPNWYALGDTKYYATPKFRIIDESNII